MLKIVDSISDPGARNNDDLWGCAKDSAWILDGATGLSAERMFPHAPSDAAWFVTAIHQALLAQTNGLSLESAVATVRERFGTEAVRVESNQATWPSASIALLRVSRNRAELANLGDCKLLWRQDDSEGISTFGTSDVLQFDHLIVKEIRRLHAQGLIEPEQVWSRLVPLIQKNRDRMNTAGGYWILDVNGRGLDRLQRRSVTIGADQLFLLLTDGLYRLVDTYHAYTDESLFDAAVASGLAGLCAQLREIEASDPKGLTFPRIKARDDATAILVRAEIMN